MSDYGSHQQPISNNPYQSPQQGGGLPGHHRQPEKSKAPWIIGGLIAGVLVLCCAGCGVGLFWMFGLVSDDIQEQVQLMPEIQEHIGIIETFSFNLIKTGEADNDPGGDTLVYDLAGDKGKGMVYVVSADDVGDEFTKVTKTTLIMVTGETYECTIPED